MSKINTQNNIPNQVSLQRFIDAQNKCYPQVINELSLGRKTSHWIWYIFPQAYGLGFSQYSKLYGIHGLSEAKAYWSNSLLRERYEECLNLMLDVGDSAENILGHIDAKKLQSSITLFLAVDIDSGLLNSALERLFIGKLDSKSVDILKSL